MILKTFTNFQTIERSDKVVSARGGLVLYDGFLKALNVEKDIVSFMPVSGSNHGKPAWDYVRSLSLLQYGGGRHINDLHEIRKDKELIRCGGTGFIPSDSAAGDWLQRMGEKEGVLGMSLCNSQFVEKLLRLDQRKEYSLHIDPTIINLGDKSDAEYVYTGQKGDRPIIVSLRELPFIVHSDYRKGNAMGGAVSALSQSFHALKFAGKKVSHVSGDSEFYTSDVVNYLSDKTPWTIVARQDSAVKEEIHSIPEKDWKPFYTKDGLRTNREVAMTTHAMNNTEAFTLVVLRWRNKEKTLFDSSPWCYHAIATNMEVSPEKEISLEKEIVSDLCRVVWKYNERVGIENVIKELKNGIGMESMPCNSFEANSIWFAIGVFTYNMMVAQKHFVIQEGMERETIKTIRWKLMQIPVWLASHAGRITLKIAASLEKFNLFLRIVERTEKLACVT